MSRIHVLSPLLINQIAAGECIERPASVVKELLENSLDAGATQIEIEIEDAGNRLIRVADNGCGMDEEDLPLALTSHATSKILTSEDLMNIRTLGFRGEALASISSVAEVVLASATEKGLSGYEIEARNGIMTKPKPRGMARGTIVEVRNLFFNIPARRKFLKTKSTEMGHITEIVTQIALAAHGVSFKLSHNGRSVLSLTASAHPLTRIQEVLESDKGVFLQAEQSLLDYNLLAYLGLPQDARSSNKWQYCYINGRSVKDRILLRALQNAYEDYLPPKRFGMAVLYLTVAPNLMDVNVHPNKVEVRYRESGRVYEIVYRTVSERLKSPEVVSEIRQGNLWERAAEAEKVSAFQQEDVHKSAQESAWNTGNEATDSREDGERRLAGIPLQQNRTMERNPRDENFSHEAQVEEPYFEDSPMQAEASKPSYGAIAAFLSHEKKEPYLSPQAVSMAPPEKFFFSSPASLPASEVSPQDVLDRNEREKTSLRSTQSLFFSAVENLSPFQKTPSSLQIHKSYLVLECEDGMMIVDQHALHERILYNRLRKAMEKGKILVQRLLFPQIVSLTHDEMPAFLEWQKALVSWGIETKVAGANTVEIHSLPQILGKDIGKEIVLDLLASSEDQKDLKMEYAMEKILATMACKAAIKAGDPLTKEEIASLLREHPGENTFYCPHGRPALLKITLRELEKYFKRT